jgi:hypothetical protein
MVCRSLAPFVVLVTTLFSLQVQCGPVVFEQRGICATEDPDTSFLDALQRVRTDETQLPETGSEARNGPIEIETWFHIISSKAEQDQVSDDMIDSQVSSTSIAPVLDNFIASHGRMLRHGHRSPFCKMRIRMPVSNIDCKASPVM